MVTLRCLDLSDETFRDRFKRMPDIMTPYDLVKLRLFENVQCVKFAVQRGHIPFIKKKMKSENG
jgi:hypothetical protein